MTLPAGVTDPAEEFAGTDAHSERLPLPDRLRAATTGVMVGGWTVGLFGCWCLTMPMSMLRRRWFLTWQTTILRVWAQVTARILGVRITVTGSPPKAPFFLVSNHLSYVDIVVLATQVGGAFVSKAELGTWPGFGHIARAMGTIFIDRSSKRDAVRTLGRIQETVEAGGGIVVFPEGTSSPGAGVMPFKAALLDYPARAGLPVHTASITYATGPQDPPAHLAVCWWGTMTFLPHLSRLTSLKEIRAMVTFADAPIADADRRRLAERLRTSVAERFVPVVSGGSA